MPALTAPAKAQQPKFRALTIADWRTAERAGALGKTDGLRKLYPVTVAKADDAGSAPVLDFTISTQSVDRDQDTVAVSGWDLKHYLKNPVVLWAHMYNSYPVAKALSVSLAADALKSRAEFISKEMQAELPDLFGYTVYRLYTEGFLSAVSVGFIPKKWSMVNDAEAGRQYAYDILQQELLEYSCCPVPSNPEALLDAKSKGIDCAPIASWAEQFLQAEKGDGFWAPRDLVERSFYLITGKGASVLVGKKPKPAAADDKPVEGAAGDQPDNDPEAIAQDSIGAQHESMKAAHAAQAAHHDAMGDHLKAIGAAEGETRKTLLDVATKNLKAQGVEHAKADAAHAAIGAKLDALGTATDASGQVAGAKATHAAMKAVNDTHAELHKAFGAHLKDMGDGDLDDAQQKSIMGAAHANHKAQTGVHGAMGALHKAFDVHASALDAGDTSAMADAGKAIDESNAPAAVKRVLAVIGLARTLAVAIANADTKDAEQYVAVKKSLLDDAHKLVKSLGSACDDPNLGKSVRVILGDKAGARHSSADMSLLHQVHSALIGMGSACKDLPDAAVAVDTNEIDLESIEVKAGDEEEIDLSAIDFGSPAAEIDLSVLSDKDVEGLVRDTLRELAAK